MKKSPSTACCFIGTTAELDEVSAALLEGSAALTMDASIIEMIIKDKRVAADEHTMFRALKRWIELDPRYRKDFAMELVKSIKLEEIVPLELQVTVEKSGLVTAEQLLEVTEFRQLKDFHEREFLSKSPDSTLQQTGK